jgi:quinol monooxygenase YgiN
MILATIKMIIPPKKHNEAVKILTSIAAQYKIHPGCLGCHIYNDVQEHNVIMFEEMWRNEEDLVKYLRSEKYNHVLEVMEMALKHPEVRFITVSTSTGIETVEKARSSTL